MSEPIIWSELGARARDVCVERRIFGTAIRENDACRNLHWTDSIKPNGGRMSARVPRYSMDIAAAWAVVENLEAEGLTVEYRTYGPTAQRRVTVSDGGTIQGYANADTAPEAICIAALRAVGVEVGT